MIGWHIKILWGYFHGLCSWQESKFSSHIYLLSPLSDQLYPGQYFPIQSEIKDLLKIENIGTDHKEYIYDYASDNLGSQIHKLVSKWERVRKTKKKHAHKLWLNSYRQTWINSLSIILLLKWWLTKLPEGSFVTYCTYALWFTFIHALVFYFQ